MRETRRSWGAVVLAALLLVAAACGNDAADAAGDEGEPRLEVLDAFTVPGEHSIAVYLTIGNDGGSDALVGAELSGPDQGRAEHVSMHHTVVEDGLAQMRPTERIEIPAGGEAALEPGRAHLMVERLRDPVALGDELALTLRFERTGELTVPVVAVDADTALARVRGESTQEDPR